MNLYAAKVLENATIKENLFQKLSGISLEATQKIKTKQIQEYKVQENYRVEFTSPIFTDVEKESLASWIETQKKQ